MECKVFSISTRINRITPWKFKGLSEESIKPTTVQENSLGLGMDISGAKI